MLRWFNRHFKTDWRPRKRSRFIGGTAFLVLFFTLSLIALASHITTTWDFSTSADYTFDSNKIVVTGGLAKLKSDFTVVHDKKADFDTGTYSNTEAVLGPPERVQLNATGLTAGSGTYTSPVIDSGTGGEAATIWKTLSHARTLHPTPPAPSATFSARNTITSAAGTTQYPSAGDLNKDGAVDVVAADTAGKELYWYKSNSANPTPVFEQRVITSDSIAGAGGQNCGVVGQNRAMFTRHGIADLDNDLDMDVMEPGQSTANTISMFLYVNPFDPSSAPVPECSDQLVAQGRLFEDIRLANVNGDKYQSTDPYKNGQDILDVAAAEAHVGSGPASSPSGGVFWFRNDGTTTPDAPVFGTRSIDAYVIKSTALGKGRANIEGPTTVAVGDLDKDGNIDVVAGWPYTTTQDERPDGTIRPSTGPQIRGYLSGGGDPPSWLPTVVTGSNKEIGFQVATIAGTAKQTNQTLVAAAAGNDYSSDLLLADIDGDGYLDVVHAAKTPATITWYKNPCTTSPCSLSTVTGPWTAFTIDASASGVTSVDAADLDLDGDIDLVANTSVAPYAVWYRNDGGTPPTFTKQTSLTGATAAATGVVVANLNSNGDRAPDIIAANASGATTIDWWQNATPHSNIRFQVRSCDDAACVGESFVGPDGTANSYYTLTSTSETIRAPKNRYFQYRFYFFTNDAAKNPNLQSVTINYERPYYNDNPTIKNNTGVAYTRITDFAEVLSSNMLSLPAADRGVVKYQISNDGTIFYYWNASSWVVGAADGGGATLPQASDAATIKANITSFSSATIGVPPGTFYFKAFLKSDGVQVVELDSVSVKPDIITVDLTAPIGGESWGVGSTRNITWTYSCQGSPCGNLRLEYSINSGTSWNPIASGALTSPFAWTIPAAADTAGAQTARVRITDIDTPVVTKSSANFAISGFPALTITNPTGTSSFTVGDAITINWNYAGSVLEPLRLDYSLNGGPDGYPYNIATGVSKGTGGVGSIGWTAPASATSTLVKIRLRDSKATPTEALSANFTIKGILNLTSPTPGTTAGQTAIAGQGATIAWNANGVPNVKIEYSTDNFSTSTVIAASAPSSAATGACTIPAGATGCFLWTPPDLASSTVKIRVSDARSEFTSTVNSLSPNNFTIKGNLTFDVADNPVATSQWVVGDPVTITWHSTGVGAIPTVTIKFSKLGNFVDTETLATAVTNGANVGCTPPADVGALKGGCFVWSPVQDRISTSAKVRIEHASDATVLVDSAPFIVKGKLSVVAPVSTNIWTVNSSQTITWTKVGSIATVNLYYSTNNFTTSTLINTAGPVANGATGGSFSWTVPDAISTNVKVKIVDADAGHPLTEVISDAFTIKGSLSVTSPVGTDIWAVSESRTLAWTKVGSIATVNLYYSTNDFVTSTLINTAGVVTNGATGGSFSWTIPDSISSNVKIKVVDADAGHPLTEGISAAFTIKGGLTVTAPVATDIWTAGESRTISWTKAGSIATVNLYYSTNNFSTQTLINTAGPVANGATGGSFSWTVADAISANVKIKVVDADAGHPASEAISAAFTIKGGLTVTSPVGTSAWAVASTQTISWTKTGSIATVNLFYSTDNFASLTLINTAGAVTNGATGGSFLWTIPDAVSTNVKVKIVDADAGHPATEAISAAFTIKGGLTVTAPTAGQIFAVNDSTTITWTKAGSIATVNLYYSTNNFASQTLINTAGAVTNGATGGSFLWTIPDAVSTNVKVKVVDADAGHPATEAISAAFTIKGILNVTSPVSGDVWPVGSSKTISWTKTGSIATVNLYYSTNNFATQTLINTAGAVLNGATGGSFAWTVADAISTNVKIKVVDADAGHPVTEGISAAFTIQGALTVTAPTAGQIFAVNDSTTITWTKAGNIATVNLYYSTNNFTTQTLINTAGPVTNGATGGSFAWTVPDVISSNVKIKVVDADAGHPASEAISGAFTIKGGLAVTAPTAGQIFAVNGSTTITWSKAGSIATVNLYYSLDNFVSFTLINTAGPVANGATGGSFLWTIPDAISANVKVKVVDADAGHPASEAISGAFTIKGGLTVTAPTAGQTFSVNGSTTITWTKTGAIGTVNLYYSINDFATQTLINTAGVVTNGPTGGSFAWTVADAISTNVKIKVVDADAGHPASEAISAAFTIKGGLAVTSPVSGDAWPVGSAKVISWTRTGSIATVNVYYSTNDFASQTLINTAGVVTNGATGGSFSWTIPDAISTNVKVKVVDADSGHPATEAISAAFTIKGDLTVTAPTAGQIFQVGGSTTLAWTKAGSVATVNLYYSTNNFTTQTLINTAAPVTNGATGGSFAWTVPDVISSNVKIKVVDADAGHPASEATSGVFTIKGVLTVTAPTAGQIFQVGGSTTLTWTKAGSIATVNLYYSTNDFATFTLINTGGAVANGATGGSFAWTVPDAISTNVKVKVVDADAGHPLTEAISPAFTIQGVLSITSPVLGDSWAIGSTQTISWNKSGSIATVNLYYSTNDFVASTLINTAGVVVNGATGGSFAWTIPDAISTNVKVKVVDADSGHPATEVISAAFTIKGGLTVTAPTAGEILTIGTTKTITWTKAGSVSTVNLYYSTNNFSTQTLINTAGAVLNGATGGSFSWTIPDAISTNVKVKVVDADAGHPATEAISAAFTIKGILSITSPVGTDAWTVAGTQVIAWTKTGSIATVNLYYSTNDFATVTLINTGGPVTNGATGGSFSWTIPDAISSNVKVKVVDADAGHPATEAISAAFTIKGGLTVTAPSAGEILAVNDSTTITWTKAGSIATVNLYYSTNDFATQTLINTAGAVTNGATGGSFAWTVPDVISTNVKIKVVDADAGHPASQAISGAFTIKGGLAVTSPVSGDVWPVGSTKTISWTKVGSIATVNLYYSTNNFASQTLINTAGVVTNGATGGSFSWAVPDAIGTNVKINVVDADAGHPLTEAISAAFTIQGGLTVTAPTAGQIFTVNDSTTITWTKAGSVATVNLYYSTNNFTTQTLINTAGVVTNGATGGSFAWTVPDAISSNVKVKVVDADAGHPATETISAAFTIKGGLTVTAPTAGQIFSVNQGTTITWTKAGSIATANLYYSTDNFVSFTLINTAGPVANGATGGSFLWTVPDAISANVKVKVVDADAGHPASEAISPAFTIKGGLTVTAPTAGQTFAVNASTTITWTKAGSIATVNLYYSTNNFTTQTLINTAGAVVNGATGGSFAWTVPDAISTNVKVKVVDADLGHPATEAISGAFTIKGGLAVTSPVSGDAWPVASSKIIAWTKTGSIATVNLYYSINDFATQTLINTAGVVTNGATGGSFSWTVPDAISSNVKIKVVDADAGHPATETISAAFTIKGGLTVTAPTAGQIFKVNASTTITWTKAGSIATVNLYYSTNNFTTQTLINTAGVVTNGATGGSFSWTVPDAISANVKVKAVDADAGHPASEAISEAFTIEGILNITSPVSGDLLVVNSTKTISWTKTGSIGTVNLYYSTNDFATQTLINTAGPVTNGATGGSFSWTVADAISTNVKVKVVDADAGHPATEAISAAFTIKGGLTVTSPVSGDAWAVNTTQTISWTKVGSIATVNLYYSTNDFTSSTLINTAGVVVNGATGGSFAWTVPDVISTNVKVKVVDADAGHPATEAISGTFTIKGGLTVTAPTAGQTFAVNASTTITWTKAGSIATVNLYYSTDNFASFSLINTAGVVTNGPTGGSFAWTIPDAISTNVKVKVVDADAGHPASEGISPAFTIKGILSITSPVATDVWTVGSAQSIAWNKTGSIATVNLYYSTNDFATLALINTGGAVANGATGGSFLWTIPDAISSNVKVKVVDADAGHPATEVISAAFTIKGGLTVTAPTAGQTLGVNDSTTITWTKTGSIATVNLYYSTNDFVSSTLINTAGVVTNGATGGSFLWTIPDAISSNVKVKVVDADAGHPASQAISATFTIKGGLAVTSPVSGDVWPVGSTKIIAWSKSGSIATVNLYYSTNDFVSSTLINTAGVVTNGATGGSFSWTVPDAISSNVKVKVVDADAGHPATEGISAAFTIKGGLTVTAPTAGQLFTVNGSTTITWSKTGSIATVNLYYSTNDFATQSLINTGGPVTNGATGGSFSWTIPDAIGTNVKVKVVDADAGHPATEVISGAFTIKGGLAVSSPVGTDIWTVGSTQTISWTKTGSIATVNLYYSTNDFATQTLINTAAPVTNGATGGSFSWTVGDAISTNVKVKVVDADAGHPASEAVSAAFTIKGGLTVTAPLGGETFTVNASTTISWTKVGSIATVNLYYSKDDFATQTLINTGGPVVNGATGGSFAWTVADAIGTNVKIKVVDADAGHPASQAISAAFTIKGGLTVTAPLGGETFTVNGSTTITWTKVGSIATVNLYYSTDNFVSFSLINTAGVVTNGATGGSFAWTVPDAISTSVKIKVVDADAGHPATEAISGAFTIRGGLTVTSPVSTDAWAVNTTQTISWTKNGTIATVNLYYSTNDFTTQTLINTAGVVANGPTGGSFLWTIPDAISTNVKVKVLDADAGHPATEGISAAFTIKGGLSVTAPSVGQTFVINDTTTITWSKTGSIGTVNLYYSTNNFTTQTLINTAGAVTNSLTGGSFSWTIPDAISTNVKVKVVDADAGHPATEGISAAFNIKGILNVTSPASGDGWPVGSTKIIAWSKTGSIATVNLYYSTNNFASQTLINTAGVVTNGATGGSFSWTIPDAISTNVKVKVVDADAGHPTIEAISAAFTIQGNLTVTAPAAGQIFTVNDSTTITWTKSGSIATVNLYYSTNNFTSQTLINTASPVTNGATGGSFTWTVPDAISPNVKVKVVDADAGHPASEAISGAFTIKGGLNITSPVGTDIWVVNSTQTIAWTKTGSIATVNLYYSKDDFATSTLINTGGAVLNGATGGSFLWTIPDAISTNVKVKVLDADAGHPASEAISAAFKIKGSLTVTSPVATDSWGVGTTQTISWNKVGSIATVNLYYSTDNFTSQTLMNTAGPVVNGGTGGSFAWLVPEAIGTNVKVKVVDADAGHPATEAISPPFTIKGFLSIVSPVSGDSWPVGSSRNIVWNKNGNIATVNLYYSTNNFVSQTLINTAGPVSNGATGGSFAWTIPDVINANVKVKVVDADAGHPLSEAVSAAFAIKGGLTVTAPTAGQIFAINDATTITWSKTGSIATVNLYYSTNDFVSFSLINTAGPVSNGATGGSFAWTIPDAIGTNVKVKVVDADAGHPLSEALSGAFTVRGILNLVAPTGGQTFTVNSSTTIGWTKVGSILTVNLYYSTDNFASLNLINTAGPVINGASGATFAWTIPDAISANVKIKVVDADPGHPLTEVISGAFTIKGSLTLTSPVGTDAWPVGSSRTIAWTKTGSIATVNLYYSTNDFTTSTLINTAGAVPNGATGGSFAWTVPDAIGTNVKVKVLDADAGHPLTEFVSPAFTIKGGLAVTSPVITDGWVVATNQTITWTKAGSVATVNLYYSTNDFATQTLINTAGAVTNGATGGSFAWTVPDAISSNAKVKVVDADAGHPPSEALSAAFTIKGGLTLTGPVGTDVWPVATTQTITWTKVGSVATVNLYYSTNDFATQTLINTAGAVTNGASGGSFAWTVPDAISSNVKVKVVDADAGHPVSEAISAIFTVRGNVRVVAPNGVPSPGETWRINTQETITWWTAGTIGTVSLEYSTNGGVSYASIAAAANNGVNGTCTVPAGSTGCFTWTIPDTPSANAIMRVKDAVSGHPLAQDSSDGPFRIQGFVTVTSPNTGNEVWTVGTSQTITWTSGGQIPNVKIEYSKSGDFLDAVVITTSAVNTPNVGGSLAWTVPNAISTTAKIRISDPADPLVFDLSDLPFKINAAVLVKAPNGAERWITNEVRTITWNITGTVAQVKLEYSKDNFVTPVTIAAAANNGANTVTLPAGATASCTVPAGATGCYPWMVTDLPAVNPTNTNLVIAADTKIRVLDADSGHPAASDQSDATFKVDYYTVKWVVKDFQLGTHLSSLEGREFYNEPITNVEKTIWTGSVQKSPVSRAVPGNLTDQFGNKALWKMFWDQDGYFRRSTGYIADGLCRDLEGRLPGDPSYKIPYVGWCSETDHEFFVLMESTLVHNNEPISQFGYDVVTNSFSVDSWLLRDGTIFPAVKEAKVEIYDADSATPNTAIATLSVVCTADHSSHPHVAAVLTSCPTGPDERGAFHQKWDFTGKVAKVYKFVTTVTMDAGTAFSALGTLDASQQVAIGRALGVPAAGSPDLATKVETTKQEIRTDVAGVKTDVAGVKVTVDSIKTDTTAIKTDTTAIKTATEVTIPAKLDTLQTGVTAILEDTSTKIPQRLTTIETEFKAGLRAKILNRPTTVKRGNTITVQFQSGSGLSPVLTLYDPSTLQQVINAPMTEIGTTGIYKYNLPVNSAWTLGDYTVMVTESTKGSLESMVLTVADADIPSIGTDLAAVQTKLNTVDTNLSTTLSRVDSIKLTVEDTNADLVVVDSAVKDIKTRWGTLTAQQIMDNITNNVAARLGSSTDAKTAATIFGRLADLDADIAAVPAAVSASVEAAAVKVDTAAAKVDTAAAKVESAATSATSAAATVEAAAATATTSAATLQSAAATAQSAATEVTKAGQSVDVAAGKVETAAAAVTTAGQKVETAAAAVTTAGQKVDVAAGRVEAAAAAVTTAGQKVETAAAGVDTAAAKVELAGVTAKAGAEAVTKASEVATGAASEVVKAAGIADVAAKGVIQAGQEVRAIGEKLETRFKKVEEAASGAQGLASLASSAAGEARTLIENVRNELGVNGKTETAYQLIVQLGESLNTVRETVTGIPEKLDLKPIHTGVREVSDLLKKISSQNGINLDVMFKSIDETTTDVSELKDKTEQLKVLMDVMREMGERVLERQPPKKPVIKTWFEPGSVILKILVVNPSETDTQTIPVKVYLPKEASPKDITDLGELKLAYDQEMGMYYAHGDVTLGPGQSMTKTVAMKDIWVFSEEQLSAFVNQAKEIASKLEKGPYAERAATLSLGIETKVQEILRRQRQTAKNPEEHIRAYRQGLSVITTIEQDLSALEKLKPEGSEGEGQEKSPPAKRSSSDSKDGDSRIALASGSDDPPEGGALLGRSISMTTAWRIIFAILAFLAVLSAIFFMTWHRLVGITMKREQQALPLSAASGDEKG